MKKKKIMIMIIVVLLCVGIAGGIYLYQMLQDHTPPKIEAKSTVELVVGDSFSKELLEIRATDESDGDLSEEVVVEGEVNVEQAGEYELTLSVQDHSGNKDSCKVKVIVKEKPPVEEPETEETEKVEEPKPEPETEAKPENEQTNAVPKEGTYYNGVLDPTSITPEIVSDPNSITVLVNKKHALPDSYVPNDLVAITSNNGRDMYLRAEAAQAWERMNAAASLDGQIIRVVSSYRTKEYQAGLFQNYFANDGEGAYLYSAYPRRSEHECGLAIDVSYDAYLHDDLEQSDLGIWLAQHAHEYGFILRYPYAKESITQYGYEAWHYRYVGTELAYTLKQNSLTLEEYYGKY